MPRAGIETGIVILIVPSLVVAAVTEGGVSQASLRYLVAERPVRLSAGQRVVIGP